jgi:hypothetical protein
MLVHYTRCITFAPSGKRKSRVNIMKKILFFILATVIAGIVSSCSSNQNCAAYGEKQRYQIERR